MASKLYNYLNNINITRQELLQTIKGRGIHLDEDSSLATISATLKHIDLTAIPIEPKYHTEYYENPEDDPLVWTPYKITHQLDAIWENLKPYKDDVTDLDFYPAGIFAFTTTENATVFTGTSSNSIIAKSDYSNPLATNRFNVLHTYGGTSYQTAKYQFTAHIHTIDGPVYTIESLDIRKNNDNSTATHTWDTEHYLVDEDGNQYKYIIVYTTIPSLFNELTSHNAGNRRYSSLGVICAGDSITIPYCILNPHFCAYEASISNCCTNLYHIKYDDTPTYMTQDEVESSPYYYLFAYPCALAYGYQSTSSYGNFYPTHLYRVEINIKSYTVSLYYTSLRYLNTSNINTFITNRGLANNSYKHEYSPGTTYNFGIKLVYLKAEYVHPSYLGRYATAQRCLLKYIIMGMSDDEYEQYLIDNPNKADVIPSNANYKNKADYYPYPNLKSEVLLKIIKYVNSLRFFDCSDITPIDLFMPNITYFDNTASEDYKKPVIRTLTLPAVTNTDNVVVDEVLALQLPNVTSITVTKALYPGCVELYLNGVTEIISKYSNAVFRSKLVELKSLINVNTANGTPSSLYIGTPVLNLKTAKNFKYSVFTGNNQMRLQPDSVLELANNAAVIPEEERGTYTIVNMNYYDLSIPMVAEAKRILIEKGWTVT